MSPEKEVRQWSPIKAFNLDNQYKYYWEGDLCGQVKQEDGDCINLSTCLWGKG